MASAPSIQPGSASAALPSRGDFYVPGYRVVLNAKEQPQLVQDILSVSFHDSLTDVDSVDLVVNNWDPGDPVRGQAVQGKFRYHNTHIFDPWQEIEVSMGYYRQGKADLPLMLTGEISSMAPNFPASGGSTLTVRALSFLHQFRTQQKTKSFSFPDMRDSDIAQRIVNDINTDVQKKVPKIKIQMLPQEVADNRQQEEVLPFLEMHNQYPIIFLMQRARDIGYDISIDDTTDKTSGIRTVTFHYRSSGSVLRPTYVLAWGQSLISFQPTLQTARQVNAVTVNGWNVQTKKPISETATRAELVKNKMEKIVAPEDLGVTENQLSQKTEIVVDRGFKSPQEAKQVALKTLRQLAQGFVEGKGKTVGLPDLRAGSKVKICMNPADISREPPLDRFSGIYQVTETTHTISDSGYTTDFTCRMEAKTSS